MKKRIASLALKTVFVMLGAIFVLYWILTMSPRDMVNQKLKELLENQNKTGLREEKPVIMLYPEERTEVTVRLDTDAEMLTTYPEYNDGWRVTAHPDGRLEMNGRSYRCLFWEAEGGFEPDLSAGFVVKGEDTAEFLEGKLAEIGLNEDEANDFIIYWLPRMESNKYNIISFQTDNYIAAFPLEISPKPDSLLRVFMAFKGTDRPVELPEQTFDTFERTGFAAVEWGGCQVGK